MPFQIWDSEDRLSQTVLKDDPEPKDFDIEMILKCVLGITFLNSKHGEEVFIIRRPGENEDYVMFPPHNVWMEPFSPPP